MYLKSSNFEKVYLFAMVNHSSFFRFAKIPDEPSSRVSGGPLNFTAKSESSSSGSSSESSSDTEDSEEERRNKQLKMLEKEV